MKVMTAHTVFQGNGLTRQEITKQLDGITEIISYEMNAHLFMYVEPSKAHLYSQPELFGGDVAKAFSSSSSDIDEAGKCLALNRTTACVYHLMRILENGLYALGVDLEIERLQVNWHNAIEQIEKAIGDFDKKQLSSNAAESEKIEWRLKKQFYSEAAAHFMYIKEAWRNRTAHAGQVQMGKHNRYSIMSKVLCKC
jgi:hypothetical protein